VTELPEVRYRKATTDELLFAPRDGVDDATREKLIEAARALTVWQRRAKQHLMDYRAMLVEQALQVAGVFGKDPPVPLHPSLAELDALIDGD
jgi:hypothetical protein